MLSPEQLAALLAVSPKTIYRRWREWGLTAYKIGGSLRFKRADVNRFIEGSAL